MAFQWQTDEDLADWETDQQNPAPTTPQPPNFNWEKWFRRWRLIAISLLTLLGSGYWGMIHMNRYIAEQETAAKEEVKQTAELLIRASETQDSDLLALVLSNKTAKWHEQQTRLLTNNMLLARPFRNWLPTPKSTVNHVTIAPDLQNAIVIISQTHATKYAVTPTISRTIQLSQTYYLERNDTAWRITAPPNTHWGETITQTAGRLTLIYPERDLEIIHKLAPVLQKDLFRYCQSFATNYCDTLQVTLHFTTQLDAIEPLFQPLQATFEQKRSALDLPTISLIGDPQTAEAENALFSHYSVYLLAAVNRDLFENSFNPLNHALFNTQMVSLDLPPVFAKRRPLHLTEFYSLVEIMGRSELTTSYMANPDSTWSQQTQNVVYFLQEQAPSFDPFIAQKTLHESKHYVTWISQISGVPIDDLENDWADYLRFTLWPTPDTKISGIGRLHAACATNGLVSLYEYDSALDTWDLIRPLGDSDQFDIQYFLFPDESTASPYPQNGLIHKPAVNYLSENSPTASKDTLLSSSSQSAEDILSPTKKWLPITVSDPDRHFGEILIMNLYQTSETYELPIFTKYITDLPALQWHTIDDVLLWQEDNRLFLFDPEQALLQNVTHTFEHCPAVFWPE